MEFIDWKNKINVLSWVYLPDSHVFASVDIMFANYDDEVRRTISFKVSHVNSAGCQYQATHATPEAALEAFTAYCEEHPNPTLHADLTAATLGRVPEDKGDENGN